MRLRCWVGIHQWADEPNLVRQCELCDARQQYQRYDGCRGRYVRVRAPVIEPDELPEDVIAVLQDRSVELPGEAAALEDVLARFVHDPSTSLPCDEHVWSPGEGDT